MDRGKAETYNDRDQTGLDLHVPLVGDAEDDDDKEGSAKNLIKCKIQHRNLQSTVR